MSNFFAEGIQLTLAALHRALSFARPEIHHSDQGVQYAATDYIAALVTRKIEVSMATVGHAEENGYAERVIRTIKEEEVANGSKSLTIKQQFRVQFYGTSTTTCSNSSFRKEYA